MAEFLLTISLCAQTCYAIPQGGSVVTGGSSITTPSAGTMVIQQTTSKSMINWNSYNVGANEKVIYQQPDKSSISYNNVTGGSVSTIYGSIQANGQVWLVNPAGIFFGPGAHVNVGGLLATTRGISPEDFMAGNYHFKNLGGAEGEIVNQGTIIAAEHGLVALVGSHVTNNGLVQANLGHVILASGDAFTISFDGNDLIQFQIDKSAVNPRINNTGTLMANGGQILVTAKGAASALDNVINLKGVVQAKSVYTRKGEIIISGDPNAGVVHVAAKMNASGKRQYQSGGRVSISGYKVLLQSQAVIDVSGSSDAGTIFIGSKPNSLGVIPNSSSATVMTGAFLFANSIHNNSGGTGNITVSSASVIMNGTLSAQGGKVVLTSFNAPITQSFGAINADSLVISSVGGSSFMANNNVGTLTASNSGGGDVLLNNTGNLSIASLSQHGGGSVTVINNGDLTVNGAIVSDGGAISLTAANANHLLTINNVVTSNGGDISYYADHMTLAGLTNSASGLVTLAPVTQSTAIELGVGAVDVAGVLGLDNSELASIYSNGGLLIGGSSFTGGLTVLGAVYPAHVTGGTLSLVNGGAVNVNAALTSNVNVNVISANNNITFNNDGRINAYDNTVTLSALNGSVTGNDSGAANVTANALGVYSANGIGTSNVMFTSAVNYFWGSNTEHGDIQLKNIGPLIIAASGISNLSGGSVQVLDTASLTVAGPINTTDNGNIILSGNGLILTSNLNSGTGGMVRLNSAGSISQIGGGITAGFLDVNSVSSAVLNANNIVAAIAASISGITAGNNFIFTDTPPPAVFNALTIRTVSNASANGIISISSNSNLISLDSITNSGNGDITLSATHGAINVLGEIHSNAGTINLLGKYITVSDNALIDASGTTGGGNIYIGGSQHGNGPLANAETTYVAASAKLYADALMSGDGGNVVLWSNSGTQFYGSIYARGGAVAGNGGSVEVSSLDNLIFKGLVVTTAANGQVGTLLLDPKFLIVATSGGSAYSNGTNNLFANNSAGTTIITPASIIAAAANITLQANSDVIFFDPLVMTGSGNTLTVTAGRSILVSANVSTNNGAISMSANNNSAVSANRETTSTNNPPGYGDNETVNGNITLATGVTINSGTANTSLVIGSTSTAPFTPGSITQGATGGITAGSVTLTSAGSGTVGSITNPILTTTTGSVVLTAASGGIFLSNTGNLSLGSVSTGGNLAITAAGAIAQTGAITVTGTSSFTAGANSITLTNASNAFTGAVTLSNSGANNVTFVNNIALNLGLSALGSGVNSITSNASFSTSGGLTAGGNLTITAATGMTIANSINVGASTLLLRANNGGAGANNFSMSAGGSVTTTNATASAVTINVNNTTGGTGTATLGNIATGAGGGITVATNVGGNTTGGSITQNAATLLNSGTGGSITLTTGAAAAGIGTSGANILSQTGTVTASTGSAGFYVTNNQALTLGAVTTTGPLSVIAAGSINQSGVLTVTGASTFGVTAATSDILLDTQANNLASTVTIAGTLTNVRNLQLRNINASAAVPTPLASLTNLLNFVLNFPNASVSLPAITTNNGLLTVTAGGSITTTGNLITNGGNLTLTAGTGFTLANNINTGSGTALLQANFAGVGANHFSMSAGVTITSTNTSSSAVIIDVNNASGGTGTASLGGITTGAGGSITVATNFGSNTTGGVITQTPATLLSTGASGAINLSTGAASAGIGTNLAPILTQTTTVTAQTGSAGLFLTNNQALTLGAMTITGPLTMVAAGSINQSGVLSVTGTATFGSTVAASDILLDTQSNNLSSIAFTGTLSNIRNLSIKNINASATLPASLLPLTSLKNLTINFTNAAVVIPESTLTNGGNLSVTAAGAVTQAGQLIVPGTTTITAGANPITLTTGNNIFIGLMSLSNSGANNVAVTDNGGLFLGNVAVGTGTLTLNSTGAITQQAGTAVTQTVGAGQASFLSLGGFNLTNAGNVLYSFNETNLVSGNVSLTNAAPNLQIGTISTAGGANITVNNTGNITTSSAVSTTANGSIALTATGTTTLNGPINSNGTGSVSVAGSTIYLGYNGNNVTTSGGSVIFNSPVIMTNNPTISSGAGDITFNSTLDGAFSPTLSSTGTVTFGGAVGGTTPLASLTITASTPGLTVIDNSITTTGAQLYGNPVNLGGSGTFTGSTITIGAGVRWLGAYTLDLVGQTGSGNAIILNGAMNGSSGTLNLTAPIVASPTLSNGNITTGANGSVNVGTFNLKQGYWLQNGSLPGFSASNFMLNTGAIPSSNVEFVRIAGGTGTLGSPRQITDIYGLQGIQSNTNFLGLNYQLNNSFNASSTNGWNSGAGFITIGSAANPFTGTLKGQSSVISNLKISSNTASNIGLFGVISAASSITNVGLSSASVTSTLAGATNIGALVGQNNGIVQGSFSTGTVTAGNNAVNVGGLIGDNLGTVNNSTANPGASYSTANVSVGTSSQNIGGLIGKNEGTGGNVSVSYSSGNISAGNGSSNIGGLIGNQSSSFAAAVQNTYSISAITAASATAVGGLVGLQTSGPISNSYSSGSVPAAGTNIGGFIGNTSIATNTNNFYDTTSSATSTSVGAGSSLGVTQGCFSGSCPLGGTGTSLSATATFSGATWSITAGPTAGTTPPATTWLILPGQTRPMLAAEWGTSVTSSHQLQLMDFALGASYSLSNNINLSNVNSNGADVWGGANGPGFQPIGNTSNNFTGSLNGNSNTISNLYMNTAVTTGTGLFGATSSAVTISNVNLTGVNITNTATSASLIALNVGALVGQNNGTITQSNAAGSVTTTGNFVSNIGGLVGQNNNNITAPTNNYSFSTVTVTSSGNSNQNIGGLIGQNAAGSSISNVYSSGAVISQGNSVVSVGGLVGGNQGAITLAYSSSPVTLSGTSPSNVGDLAGTNDGAGTISITYTDGNISATNATTTATNVGGFVGYENSSSASAIQNTYSWSNITLAGNGTNVGGMLGNQASGPIIDSYSIGKSTISGTSTNVGGFIGTTAITTNVANFFDTTTSATATGVGNGSTNGVTPKVTSAMKQLSTFNSAGWDFSTPIWGILDGFSYPYFSGLSLGIRVIDPSAGSLPSAATNGATLTPLVTATSGTDYYYLFKASQLTAGNGILFYNTTGAVSNGIIVVPSGTSYTTPIILTMTANQIQVGGDNTGTLGTNNFGSAPGAGDKVLFTSGGSLTLGNTTNPNVTLTTNANTTLLINGAVSSFGSNDAMTLAGPVTLNNGGAIVSTSGVQTYNGNVTMSSPATLATSSSSGAIVVNGNINGGTSLLTFNNIDNNSIISGVLSGSGGLSMQGSGTLTLAGNNTYSGNTTLISGTLNLNTAGASPTPMGTSTLNLNGGTLTAGASLTGPVSNPYVLGGIANISTISGTNPLTLSGPGTLTSNYILNINNTATTTLSGNLSGGGQLNEIGGTLALSGSNNSSYSGTASVNSNGLLQVGVATNVLGTGSLILNAGRITSTVPLATISNSFTSNSTSAVEGTNNITFSGPNLLYSGALTVTNTGTTTFSGNLTGAGGLTVNNGTGNVIVSGTNNSPYLGATTINGGSLQINSQTNALGTGTGNSLVLNGGTLSSIYSSGVSTLANKFLVGGTGNATIAGTNSITIQGNGTLTNVLNVNNTAGTITFSGVISNGTTNGSIVQNGTGGTLVLSGKNSYGSVGVTGTTVSAGTLIAQHSNALGVGNVIVSTGGQLALNGLGAGSLTIANPMSLSGTGVGGTGALVDIDTNGDNNIVSGPITLTGNATIGVTSPTTAESLTLSGGITNAGFTTTFTTTAATSSITESGVITGLGGLTMTGSGTLNLSGTNTFTGNNSVTGGTVAVSNAQGLGLTNTTTIATGGTVKVAGVALVASEAFNLNGGTLTGTQVAAVQPSVAGTVTLAQNSADTISTLAAGDNFTLSGVINGTAGVGTNGDLTLSGPGTITFSNTVGATTKINSLTDNSGTLAINGGSISSVGFQTYNNPVTISANTTLSTSGVSNNNITFNNTFTGARTLTLNSAGNITEAGLGALKSITTLTTTSATGTTLNGANTVTTFNATDASATGVALTNTIATLTVSGVNVTGGGPVNINNTGIIADSGTINTTGTVSLTASSSISQTGKITNASLLTTNSKGGTVLSGLNTVSSFNATNTTSGNITLTNTAAPLSITGIAQSGGGNTSVTNTGAMNVNGVITGGAGTVTLTATGALLTVNNNITATNRAISLTGSGITQNAGASSSTIVNSGSGNITYTAGSGAITTTSNGSNGSQILSTGIITLAANSMVIDTTANSQIGGTGIGAGVASNVVLKEGTSTTPIFVATTGAGLQLSSAMLASIRGTNLRIGGGTSGLITLGAWSPTQAYASSPGVVTLNSGAGISQTGALTLGASSNLLLRGSGTQALTNASNVINTVAASLSSGTVSITNSGTNAVSVGSLTDDLGTVNGINASGGVTIKTTNASSSLVLNQSITANTAGTDILLVTPRFTNNAGASALVPGVGNYQVWSSNPSPFTGGTPDNRGGIVSFNYKQYNATFGVTTPLGTGNGFLYTLAPVVTPSLVPPNVQKVYDGTTAATLVSGNYSPVGTVDSDTVIFNNPTSGTYDTPFVGSGKTVSVTGISIASASNGSATVYGYQLGSSTASAPIGIITGAVLTIINVTANNKVYDGTTSAVINVGTAALVGVQGADSVTLNTGSAVGAFVSQHASNGITVTTSGFTISGPQASNYILTQPTTTANITPAPLVVSLTNTPITKVYDGNTNAPAGFVPQYSATGFVPGDSNPVTLSNTGSSYDSSHVLTATTLTTSGLVLTGITTTIGSLTSDYSINTSASRAASITPATLTISGTRVYDGTTAFSSTVLTAVGVAGQTFSLTGSGTAGNSGNVQTSQQLANLNTLALGVSGNGGIASDYNPISAVNSSVSITPATLTYNANTANMVYGNSVPSLSGTITGFVPGENQANATTGTLTFTTTATSSSNVGNYVINGTGLTANNGNYTFVQAAGNATALTITQRPINITGSKVYDGTVTFTAAQLTAGNIVNGDTVNLGGTATVSSKNQGNYTSFVVNSLTSSNSNYTVVGGTVNVSITPATLTYNANAASMVYGNAVPALSGTVTGFVSGENIGNATTGTLAFNTSATSTSNVGSYAINGSGLTANNGNYTFIQAAGNATALTITQRPINITGSKVYDGTVTFTAAQLTAGNIVNGDTVNLGGTATVSSKNQGNYTSFVVNSLTSSNSNYTVLGGTVNVSITPATLTYNANAVSMVYGNAVPALSGTVTGFVSGENIGNATTGTLAFNTSATSTSNVGSYAINGSGLTANNGNYTFIQAAGNATALTITQRPINITGSKVYDGTVTFTAAQLTAGNIVNGDTVNLGGTATVSSKNQGNYTSFVVNSLTSSNSNYTVLGGTVNVSITPATLTYNANAASMVYGDAVPALSGTVTGFVSGENIGNATTGTLAFNTSATSTSNVGSYAINGSGLTANNGNYTFIQAAGNATALTITQRPINITGSKVYDGTVTFTAAQLSAGNIVNGDTVNLGGTATVSSKNQGNYTSFVVNSLTSSNSNYTVVGGTVNASITPATLTYNANAASMVYGDAVPALSGTVTGFVPGDNIGNATTGTLAFNTSATSTSNVGSYAINGSGLTANNGNYTFIQAAGNATALTITQRPINITGSKVYDGTVTFTAAQLTAGNIVNGDTVNLGGTATVSSKNQGNYTSFVVNSLTSSNSNYTVLGGTVNVSITPATLTYNANAASMVYGNAVPALSGTVTGFVPGENIGNATTGSLAFTTTVTSTSNVGSYDISGSGLTANNGNYIFIQAPVNATALTISQRPINITGTKVYDATTTFTGSQLTAGNLVNGDTVVLTGSANVSSQNQGSYNNFVTNALTSSNGNYQVTGGTVSVSITPALLTYNASIVNMIYGDVVPVLSGAVTGFAPGDNISNATTGSLAFTTSASSLSNVGTYAVNGSGLTAINGNYTFVQAAGNATALTITPRPINITGTKVYDGTTGFTGSQLTAGNVVNGDTVNLSGSADVSSKNVAAYAGFTNNNLVASNSNYTVTGGSVSVTITPATLTYTSNVGSMVYGDPVPSLSGTVTGFVPGDDINNATTGTLTFTTTATSTSNVGSYPINGSGLTANNGNYVFIQLPGNSTALTIDQRPINLTGTKVYDGTNTFSGAQFTAGNLVNGDTVTLGGSADVVSKNVGVYSNFVTNHLTSSNSNYTVSGGVVSASVTPASLTVNSVIANNKIYNGNTLATLNLSQAQLVGVIPGDDVALSLYGYIANFIQAAVGNNIPVTVFSLGLSGSGAGNYALVQPSGLTANILPPPIPLIPVLFNIPYNLVFPMNLMSSADNKWVYTNGDTPPPPVGIIYEVFDLNYYVKSGTVTTGVSDNAKLSGSCAKINSILICPKYDSQRHSFTLPSVQAQARNI